MKNRVLATYCYVVLSWIFRASYVRSSTHRTVVYKSGIGFYVALAYKPQLLQAQVAQKLCSNGSRGLKMSDRPQSRARIYRFCCMPKWLLAIIVKQLHDIHKVKFRFHCTCDIVRDCFHWYCRLRNLLLSHPRIIAAKRSNLTSIPITPHTSLRHRYRAKS